MRTPWQWWEVCLLALVVWREARGEPFPAQLAVACSIRNRVQNPKWWGHDYATVITKKWQYSSIAAPNDPQLTLYPQTGDTAFEACLDLAGLVYDGQVANPMAGADSYYDDSILAPAWATPATFVGKLGRLSFFNSDHDHEEDAINGSKSSSI
jgi:N-acetylmuramoyl-L-alanine amidase